MATKSVLVLGGSGLLGSVTCAEALQRGHTVGSVARTPHHLEGVTCSTADLTAASSDEVKALCAGRDAVVYALGIDDRAPQRTPAYEAFFADHVTACLRVVRAAKEAGVRTVVLFGSYFTWLDRTRPELELARRHPYVRSRCAQRDAALAEATPDFRVFVLELPYILGCSPGRVPPWTLFFSMLEGALPLFFPTGGTAAVTTRQVAQATLGAIEGNATSGAYPLGGVNWSWPEFAARFFAITGQKRTVRALPPFAFVLFGRVTDLALSLRGLERGLDVSHFARVQYAESFIDPALAQQALGYGPDDAEAALRAVVEEWRRA